MDAWEALGAPGITIFESTGLGRIRHAKSELLPLMPSLENFLQSRAERHRTLITVVQSAELVDQLIAAANEILGDLSQPNKGIIFVLPVLRVVGMRAPENADETPTE